MTETIRGARWKSALLLAGCLVFVATALMLPMDDSPKAAFAKWGGLALFGVLGLPVSIYQLISPATLTLDDRGFTYVGLFNRRIAVAWSDIEAFKLYRLPRGGSMAAWDYRPGRRPKSALAGISGFMGADAALPRGLADSPARLVDRMNQRLQASRR